jgi:Uma2 family endonuclease
MAIAGQNEKISYQDYLIWDDAKRWEIVAGKAYDMTPAPSFKHQSITGNFYHLVRNALQGKRCTPGIAPTDVVLSDHDVVQPDVFVICDQRKISDQNIRGAPDLVVEVLIPATAGKARQRGNSPATRL